MAKKNATPGASSGAEPGGENKRVSVIHLKGSEAYREWLAEATRRTKYPQAVIVRWAIAQWAEKQGLEPPPEL
jgi:hypothetical protein